MKCMHTQLYTFTQLYLHLHTLTNLYTKQKTSIDPNIIILHQTIFKHINTRHSLTYKQSTQATFTNLYIFLQTSRLLKNANNHHTHLHTYILVYTHLHTYTLLNKHLLRIINLFKSQIHYHIP